MSMLPMILKLRIIETNGKRIRLWLPLFLAWIPLLLIMTILIPLIIIAALVALPFGYSRPILFSGPYLIKLLCALRGLKVDVKNEKEIVFVQFI